MEMETISKSRIQNTHIIELISMYLPKMKWLNIIRYSKSLQKKLNIPFELYKIFYELNNHKGELNEEELVIAVKAKYPRLFKDEVINAIKRFIYDKQQRAFSKVRGFTLRGHSRAVLALIEIDDGRLVSGSIDKTIKVWNVDQHQCEFTLLGHEDDVSCLVEVGHGIICSGSDDKTIRVWDINERQCIETIEGHNGIIFCMCRIKDTVIATGAEDNAIKIWDIAKEGSRCLLATLIAHSGPVTCITGNSSQLVSGSCDEMILVWRFEGDALQREYDSRSVTFDQLKGHQGTVYAIIYLNTDIIVSGSEDRAIRVWNIALLHCIQTIIDSHLNDISCLFKSSDSTFYSGSTDHCIKHWSIGLNNSQFELQGHHGSVNALSLLSSGVFCSGSEDSNIKIWNMTIPSSEFAIHNGIEAFVELNQFGLAYKHIKLTRYNHI